jgi:hypothetical protein
MIILRDAVVALAVALAIVCAVDAFRWAEARAAFQLVHSTY